MTWELCRNSYTYILRAGESGSKRGGTKTVTPGSKGLDPEVPWLVGLTRESGSECHLHGAWIKPLPTSSTERERVRAVTVSNCKRLAPPTNPLPSQ